MMRKRLWMQALVVVALLLAGCATRAPFVPSSIAASVAPMPPGPPYEDMMNPIVLNHAFTNIDALEMTLSWQPFRPGVEIAHIYSTPDGGPSAAYLKYQPGASVPLHTHGGYEHIFILKGTQLDRSGEHGPGTVIINPPGSSHHVSSPNGCLVLILWEKPVILASARPA